MVYHTDMGFFQIKHNRQLVGADEWGNRTVVHTWFCPWGSYAARLPKGVKKLTHFTTLTVEQVANH